MAQPEQHKAVVIIRDESPTLCISHADDAAPKASKSRWLAVFYLCIPVGYAAGYILGGVIAPALGWRAAFLLEAAAMLPFAAFCAFGPDLDLKGKTPNTGWFLL